MDIEENDEFTLVCNDLLNFITDLDINVSMKEILGVCPIELALLITKNRKEEE